MASTVPEVVTPAPYGKACVACSRAKVRCLYRRDGGACDRCHRLQRQCELPVALRKRSARPRIETRTSQLEDKLEDLVSLLRSQATGKAAPAVSVSTAEPECSTASSSTAPVIRGRYPVLSPPGTVNTGSSSALQPTTAASSPSSTAHYGHEITTEEAEQCLETFRTHLLPWFPFYNVSASMTAQQLSQERPFLWLSILSLTVKSTSRQIALSEQFRQLVVERAVLGSDRSLDLVLAISCDLAWSHFHNRTRPYLGVWVNICQGIVHDLGLNKEAGGLSACSRLPTVHVLRRSQPVRERTMEERRAVLGVYLLKAILSMWLQKSEVTEWTLFLEDCLTVLSERPECDGDRQLVAQIRCNLILDQVCRSPWSTGFTGVFYDDGRDAEQIPPVSYVKALLVQLQDVQRSLGEAGRQNAFIQLYLLSTELAINEGSLHNLPASTTSGEDLAAIFESFNSILHVITSWLSTCFSFPPQAPFGYTFALFSQMYHVITCLFRLTTIRHPAWDRAAVRRTADVFQMIEQFAGSLESVPSLVGLVIDNEGDDAFSKHARMMRGMKASLEAEAATMDAADDAPAEEDSPEQPQHQHYQQAAYGPGTAGVETGGALQVDLPMPDDAWFEQLFGPWESSM